MKGGVNNALSELYKVRFTLRSDGSVNYSHRTFPSMGRSFSEGSIYTRIEAELVMLDLLDEYSCDVEIVPALPPDTGGWRNDIHGLDVELAGSEITDYCRVWQSRTGILVRRWSNSLNRISTIHPGATPGLVLYQQDRARSRRNQKGGNQ